MGKNATSQKRFIPASFKQHNRSNQESRTPFSNWIIQDHKKKLDQVERPKRNQRRTLRPTFIIADVPQASRANKRAREKDAMLIDILQDRIAECTSKIFTIAEAPSYKQAYFATVQDQEGSASNSDSECPVANEPILQKDDDELYISNKDSSENQIVPTISPVTPIPLASIKNQREQDGGKLSIFQAKAAPTVKSAAINTAPIVPASAPAAAQKDPITIDLLDSSDEEDEQQSNFPPATGALLNYERICLHQDDLKRLEPGRWLNDKIIDFYMAYSKNKYKKSGKKVHVFNSLFFDKLRIMNNQKQYNYYEATRKWFANIDLLQKKAWIVPICSNHHWYTIVVLKPKSQRPNVIIMDSLKKPIASYNHQVHIIKNFIAQLHGKPITLSLKIANIPQQQNMYDCGLYALAAADFVLGKRKDLKYARYEAEDKDFKKYFKCVTKRPKRIKVMHRINKCINS